MAWKLNIMPPFKGFANKWFKNSYGTYGYDNQANAMKNIDLTDPNCLKQGFGIKTGTNGALATLGKIYDMKSVSATFNISVGQTDSTHGYLHFLTVDLSSANKLAIADNASFPHAITNYANGFDYPLGCVRESSNYFYFYNTNAGGEIGRASGLDGTPVLDDDWGSTVPTGKKALNIAPHPAINVDNKIIFGNGNYLGMYDGTTLDTERYNFSSISGIGDCDIVDLEETSSYIYCGINRGSNAYSLNSIGEICIINKDLQPNDLGIFEIVDKIYLKDTLGSMITVNGVMYVFHGDLVNGIYKIGYISGNSVVDILSFDGGLPQFHQVDFTNDSIYWVAGSKIYSLSIIDEILPKIISYPVSSKYSTIGGISALRGVFVISSTNGTNHDLSYIDGRTKDCSWTTITKQVSDNRELSIIDNIGIETNVLGSGASCTVSIYINQKSTPERTLTITGEGKSRHTFSGNNYISGVESFYLKFDWSGGSATNLVDIRKITINGHYYGRT